MSAPIRSRSFCPECSQAIPPPTVATTAPGLVDVCPKCAAVVVPDGERWRWPRTEEWMATLCKPGYSWLWELRESVLERLTSSGKKRHEPAITRS